MISPSSNAADRTYIDKAVDIAVRLSVVGVILLAGLQIVGLFFTPLIWGVILAVSFYPLFARLRSAVGGRSKLAGGLFILLGLAALIVPTALLVQSLVEGTANLGAQLRDGTLKVPAPSASVREWPLIGQVTYEYWLAASERLETVVVKLEPQLKFVGGKFAGAVAGLGAAVVETIFAILIAGLLLINSTKAAQAAHAISRALGGERGSAMIDTAAATIHSVVKGVLVVAAIQALLSAVGLFIASVPGAGLWALLVLIVAIIQLPPVLILGPIAIWVFSTSESTAVAVFFLVWSILISSSDTFLKPLFLGRGVEVPMLVILVGAIGGMLRFGVVGLFTGAVILAIAYQLVAMWVKSASEAAGPEGAAATP